MNTHRLTRMAAIAALYAAITMVLAPFSYNVVQVRAAEALTVLPFIIPESIFGLFIGCLLANIFGGFGLIDIIFGSLATLVAAYLTARMPHEALAPLPPVLVNAVVVAFILKYAVGSPFFLSVLYVGAGQFLACYGLGLPLLYFLKRYNWNKSS